MVHFTRKVCFCLSLGKTTTRKVIAMVDLITTGEAARLLGVDPRTLRKHETADGQWCILFGFQFRVYHYGGDNKSTRRYNRRDIMRVLAKMTR